ncbi:YidC/Oxa1 family membrane protein insertase [Oscillospiraceae bacterium 50-16]|nr:YidC/Oxa1 family membrane protein insertase [Lawsonibacter sp.]
MGIILQPFAWLLLFFYRAFNSYGLALIIFGIVIKLLLFPVTLKSKKSMIQTSMLSEKMQRLQKQYGKDKERYNLEVQKLYEKENVNPMGGCLWSLIPMFVLIALFGIIREPLTYFMHLSLEQIQLLAQELDWEHLAVSSGWVAESKMASLQEDLAAGKITSLFQNIGYNQLYLVSQITAENLESVKAAMNAHTAGAGDGLFVMNFQFLGLDMSVIPTWKFWTGGIKWSSIGLFLLPLVSTVVSFLSMKVSMATNRMNNQTQNAQADQTNRMMMWSMPLMSLWIGFTVPAGLSVYWITQYFVTMIQEVICGKMLKKDYEAARAASARREQEEREEEKRRKEEARLERARRLEEEKKNRGKKKTSLKKDKEPEEEGINREDSREGIRAYARGRAYIPGRFGGVTPYVDPNELIRAEEEAKAAKKRGKKAKKEQNNEEKER